MVTLMNDKQLVSAPQLNEQLAQLEQALAKSHQQLREAERDLSEEQAAVNRFRMHCQLKLGDWVEQILELKATQQSLLTRLQLRQQAKEAGAPFDEADDWFNQEPSADEAGQNTADFEGSEPNPQDENEPDPIQDRRTARKVYRELARKFHPDLAEGVLQKAYCTSMMTVVNSAYQRQDWQALRDLAGEVDPGTAAELDQSAHSRKFRKLQKKLRKSKQRLRKISEQLRVLRQDNVTKLWHRAQQVDTAVGQNWWEEVANTLQADIEQTENEIGRLQQLLANLYGGATEQNGR